MDRHDGHVDNEDGHTASWAGLPSGMSQLIDRGSPKTATPNPGGASNGATSTSNVSKLIDDFWMDANVKDIFSDDYEIGDTVHLRDAARAESRDSELEEGRYSKDKVVHR